MAAVVGLVVGGIALGVLLLLGRFLVALVLGLMALGWLVLMGVLALSVGSGVVVGAVLNGLWQVGPAWMVAAGVATALWVGGTFVRHLWRSLVTWGKPKG
jgi:hypothetical protein